MTPLSRVETTPVTIFSAIHKMFLNKLNLPLQQKKFLASLKDLESEAPNILKRQLQLSMKEMDMANCFAENSPCADEQYSHYMNELVDMVISKTLKELGIIPLSKQEGEKPKMVVMQGSFSPPQIGHLTAAATTLLLHAVAKTGGKAIMAFSPDSKKKSWLLHHKIRMEMMEAIDKEYPDMFLSSLIRLEVYQAIENIEIPIRANSFDSKKRFSDRLAFGLLKELCGFDHFCVGTDKIAGKEDGMLTRRNYLLGDFIVAQGIGMTIYRRSGESYNRRVMENIPLWFQTLAANGNLFDGTNYFRNGLFEKASAESSAAICFLRNLINPLRSLSFVSSTDIREALTKGDKAYLNAFLSPSTINILQRKDVRIAMIMQSLDGHRAEIARDVAELTRVTGDALISDSSEKLRNLIERFQPQLVKEEVIERKK
ncbi:hypothetical protein A3J90_05415 [candidate division WOR-1 bacterium RIFOXYC2_FULL_37_10]|uniref:Uncharacterized protein n=1 Tax=candidate division WOR-1 bacterium RIFOXYB2_FULL_37_13 TaxID=1802579 RepID=A0A1F4SV37_UNCSA|nr:MAG: hypothetical protein A2310_06755 [candidate division WOR-1 bacterium RIFOXYB2_FULL_37_13]OGC36472.1 MAG: hypothetical protein A3J90_05415 [candidate division WOR-1 bacterium RIFOXYC2_FULL_37_10]